MNHKAKTGGRAKWWLVGILLAAVFAITMLKTPQAITQMLSLVSAQLTPLSVFMHALALAAIILGFLLPRARTRLFTGLMAVLAASAATVALVYFILPNIVVFGLYFGLILRAHWQGELAWELAEISVADWLFGFIGLVFGLWYLHWVASPVMLNALWYSPLGVVNCPTLVTISGLLCLSSRRPAILEFTTGLVCLYFGLFGIILLGAYVDVALVACGSYQLARLVKARRDAAMSLGKLGTA